MRLILLVTLAALAAPAPAEPPLMLDLSPYFWERFATPARTNRSFLGILGLREFDGIPFRVDGRACLYGKVNGHGYGKAPTNYPDIVGVPVGRRFDELHLLHATQWSDLEGMTVALARLHYMDGTAADLPIGYGVHVRDWQRLLSEEKEQMADPRTKVVWRGPGIARFKSTQRMFKSVFDNPRPDQVVRTIDFVSTEQIASYDISAATVADRDPARPVSPAIPLPDPERNFDGRVLVRVEDPAGRAIEDVWIYPNISVPDSGWCTVATPFYTSPDGTGTARYPRAQSTCIVFNAYKPGWRSISETVRFAARVGLPDGVVVTIRMAPIPGQVALHHPPRRAVSNAVARADGAAEPPAGAGVGGGADEPVETAGTPPPPAESAAGFAPRPILLIDFPVGSRVRVETASSLTSSHWKPMETITNLPFSPYPYTCCSDESAEPMQFFRAVLTP